MRHQELGPLLIRRLAANEYLIDEMMAFVDVRISTVREWLNTRKTSKPQYPRGEKLNRLWHFMEAAGVDSPELAKLPEFGGYLARLMAYKMINLQEAVEFCGVRNTQTALRIMQGEQQPAEPKTTVADLHEVFGDALEMMEQEYRDKLASLKRPDEPKPKPETTQPAAQMPTERTEPTATLTPLADAPTAPLKVDNAEFIVALALDISDLHVSVRHALNTLSDEEIARVRDYVNSYALFELSNDLNSMGSTRALNDRKQVK